MERRLKHSVLWRVCQSAVSYIQKQQLLISWQCWLNQSSLQVTMCQYSCIRTVAFLNIMSHWSYSQLTVICPPHNLKHREPQINTLIITQNWPSSICIDLERGNVVGARPGDSSGSVWSEEKSDGPSSTTRVGIAPLPCSIDTTFSWEQFLQRETEQESKLEREK